MLGSDSSSNTSEVTVIDKLGNEVNDLNRISGMSYKYLYISNGHKLPDKLNDLSMKVGNISDLYQRYDKANSLIREYLDIKVSNNGINDTKISLINAAKSIIYLLNYTINEYNKVDYSIIDIDRKVSLPDYYFWNGFLGKIDYAWHHKGNTTISNVFMIPHFYGNGNSKVGVAHLFTDIGNRYALGSDIESRIIAGKSSLFKMDKLFQSPIVIDRLLYNLLGFSNLVIDLRDNSNGRNNIQGNSTSIDSLNYAYQNYILGYLCRYAMDYLINGIVKVILPVSIKYLEYGIDNDNLEVGIYEGIGSIDAFMNNPYISPLPYILLKYSMMRIGVLQEMVRGIKGMWTKLFHKDEYEYRNHNSPQSLLRKYSNIEYIDDYQSVMYSDGSNNKYSIWINNYDNVVSNTTYSKYAKSINTINYGHH